MNDCNNDSNIDKHDKNIGYSESGKISLVPDDELEEFILEKKDETEQIFIQEDSLSIPSSRTDLGQDLYSENILLEQINKNESSVEAIEDKEEYQEFIKEFSDEKMEVLKPEGAIEGGAEWVVEDKVVQSARHKVGLCEVPENEEFESKEVEINKNEPKEAVTKELEVKASAPIAATPAPTITEVYSKKFRDDEFESECEEIVISNSTLRRPNNTNLSNEDDFSDEMYCEWVPIKDIDADACMPISEAEEILTNCKEGDEVSMVGARNTKTYWVSNINLEDEEYFLSNEKGNVVQELTYGEFLNLICTGKIEFSKRKKKSKEKGKSFWKLDIPNFFKK